MISASLPFTMIAPPPALNLSHRLMPARLRRMLAMRRMFGPSANRIFPAKSVARVRSVSKN